MLTAAGRLAGFQSIEVRDYRAAADKERIDETNLKAAKKSFEDEYVEAKREGRHADAAAVIQAMREFERDTGKKLGYNVVSLNKRAQKLENDIRARTLENIGKVRRAEAQRGMEE
jgi:hypothetical protein